MILPQPYAGDAVVQVQGLTLVCWHWVAVPAFRPVYFLWARPGWDGEALFTCTHVPVCCVCMPTKRTPAPLGVQHVRLGRCVVCKLRSHAQSTTADSCMVVDAE